MGLFSRILKGVGGIVGLGGRGGGGGGGRFIGEMPAQKEKIGKFEPDQLSILKQLLTQGFESIGGTGIDDLARKRFSEDTIPSIAERFTAMGSGGQRSSAFQGTLGRAGSDLEAQLAAMGQQRGMQKLGMGLQPRFDTAYSPASQGMYQPGRQSNLMSMLPSILRMF